LIDCIQGFGFCGRGPLLQVFVQHGISLLELETGLQPKEGRDQEGEDRDI
jgi:hypothetical protein